MWHILIELNCYSDTKYVLSIQGILFSKFEDINLYTLFEDLESLNAWKPLIMFIRKFSV